MRGGHAPPKRAVSGYILTGGRSARFGSDKAVYPIRGRPMALWVADALRPHAATLTLVGDSRAHESLGLRVIPDRLAGAGPLGGIVAALHDAPSDWCLIAACDMPRLAAAPLRALLEAAASPSVQAVVPRTPDGRLQPLCSVFAKTAYGILDQALADGVRKVTDALHGLSWTALDVPDAAAFANVNRPEDLAVESGAP